MEETFESTFFSDGADRVQALLKHALSSAMKKPLQPVFRPEP